MTNRQPPTIKKKSISTSWLEKIPWLSVLILFITYAAFGWSISQASQSWIQSILETGQTLEFTLEEELVTLSIRLLALAAIVIISLLLTIPIAVITFTFQKSLRSDLTTFISSFVWCFLLVLMICSFDDFANLLVIISAALLVRLDFQKLGCTNWQIFLIILGVCSLAFALGMISFEFQHSIDINHITE
jgi:hypothetical protein